MALANPSFETAGASVGLAASWTTSFVSSVESYPDFSDGVGAQDPEEDFEDGWGNAGALFAFTSSDVTVGSFNSGVLTTAYESFQNGWGNDTYYYALSLATQGLFGAGELGAEGFETEYARVRVTVNDTTDILTTVDESLTPVAHGLGSGVPVALWTTGTMATGVTEGATVFAIVLDATTLQVETAIGGGALDFLDAGTGAIYLDRIGIFAFVTGQITDAVFTGAAGTDTFETGWGNAGYLTVLGPGDVTDAQFDGGAEPVEDFEEVMGTRTFTALASTSTLTLAGHPFINDIPVQVKGPGIPGGLAAGIYYWVINKTADTLQLAMSLGGAAITLQTDSLTGTATIFGDPIQYWNDVE